MLFSTSLDYLTLNYVFFSSSLINFRKTIKTFFSNRIAEPRTKIMNFFRFLPLSSSLFFFFTCTSRHRVKVYLCAVFRLKSLRYYNFFSFSFLEIYSLCVFYILSCCNITFFFEFLWRVWGTIFFSSPRSMPQFLFMTFCCDFFWDFSIFFSNIFYFKCC